MFLKKESIIFWFLIWFLVLVHIFFCYTVYIPLRGTLKALG